MNGVAQRALRNWIMIISPALLDVTGLRERTGSADSAGRSVYPDQREHYYDTELYDLATVQGRRENRGKNRR